MTGGTFANYPSLVDRPVIVSGGASGIGASLVRHFAGQGARVGFVDIADDEGRALAEELSGEGHTVAFTPCDVTDTDAYASAIAGFASRHGPARVLINNAANDARHDWREISQKEWDERIAVNLRHCFFAIKAVAPGMIEAGGGSIINFGSISWMVGAASMPIYMTSKAAMHGLTRAFAGELGQHNIRVNTLVPGAIMTKRQLELWVGEDEKQSILNSQALPDLLEPDDVARMAMFLAADDSCMISAQDFLVDGGWAHG